MAQKYPHISKKKAETNRNFLKHYVAALFGVITLALAPVGKWLHSSKKASASGDSAPITADASESKHAVAVRQRLMALEEQYKGTSWRDELDQYLENSSEELAELPDNNQEQSEAKKKAPSAQEEKKLSPIQIDSAVLRASGLQLYAAAKDLTELNEGKELKFHRVNDIVHIGIGCNFEQSSDIALGLPGGFKVYRTVNGKKTLLTKEQLAKFVEDCKGMKDNQLREYSIEESEAYKLLQHTYVTFYEFLGNLFAPKGVDFTKLPKGMQMAVIDTAIRIGREGFRDNWPKSQKKIVDFYQNMDPNSPGYKERYLDVLQELSIALKDPQTNFYGVIDEDHPNGDEGSARRAMRMRCYIGPADILLQQGKTPEEVVKYLAQNPPKAGDFNGTAKDIVEKREAVKKGVIPLICAYHPDCSSEKLVKIWKTTPPVTPSNAKVK